MVTNLSHLPSDLTVIAVPDGDVLSHQDDFVVNENLKRMGCSGRIALTLTSPTDAARAKFHHLFRTCELVPFTTSVIELVRLNQLALVMFQKLDKHFADGLLCDETERAIGKWWAEYGTDFYNSEPTDGVLGPSTVAALLGMMIGARNRLSLCGAPVPKDPFDLHGLKTAIGYFQKQHKLRCTRLLDRETVDKLHRITIKGPPGDKYGMVPKAIKSTVAEMSGRAHKVEMETCELEKFILHLSGERAKYLWHGKPMKGTTVQGNTIASGSNGPRRNSAPAMNVGGIPVRTRTGAQDKTLFANTGPYDTRNEPGVAPLSENTSLHPLNYHAHPAGQSGSHAHGLMQLHSHDPLRKVMFKTMNNRMNDAKTGLGKIKDVATGVASGISGRVTRRQMYDNVPAADTSHSQPTGIEAGIEAKGDHKWSTDLGAVGGASLSVPALGLSKKPSLGASLEQHAEQETARSNSVGVYKLPGSTSGYEINHTEHPVAVLMKSPFHNDYLAVDTHERDMGSERGSEGISPRTQGPETEALFEKVLEQKQDMIGREDVLHMDHSVSELIQPYEDAIEKLKHSPDFMTAMMGLKEHAPRILNRSQSFSELRFRGRKHEEWFPRRMSFGEIEEAVLVWEDIGENHEGAESVVGSEAGDGHYRVGVGGYPKEIWGLIKAEEEVAMWAREKLHHVQTFLPVLTSNVHDLGALYNEDLEMYHQMEEVGQHVIVQEQQAIGNEIREVELLKPKLQYEIETLQAKVDEVEEWVEGLGRQVEELERRTEMLEPGKERIGWMGWLWSLISWEKGDCHETEI